MSRPAPWTSAPPGAPTPVDAPAPADAPTPVDAPAGPDRSVAAPDASLGVVLGRRAREEPDALAFTFSDDGVAEASELTYAELHERAQAVAAALAPEVPPGGRALLLFGSGLDFVAALFGCFQAGVVGVSSMAPHPERMHRTMPRLRRVAADAAAHVVLTTREVRDAAAALDDDVLAGPAVRWIAVDDLPPAAPGVAPAELDALAFLQYTSGSTADPRGVMLSHRNLLANARLIAAKMGLSSRTRSFSWLPVSHDMGLVMGVLLPVWLGYPSALMSPLTVIKRPVRWLEGVSRFGATVSGAPDFAYALAARRVRPEQREGLDLSSWAVAFNGAEPIRADTIDAFCTAFAPVGFRRSSVYPCYGMAEATLMVSGSDGRQAPVVLHADAAALEAGHVRPAAPDTDRTTALVAVGTAGPEHAVAVVDPDTARPVPDGTVGEVLVAGPSVASGYWGHPAQSAATFGARLGDDPAPYLRTGDLGALHDGRLFVVGRRKDVVIVRGRNHHAHDIEVCAEAAHPRLRRHCSAAFAVADGARPEVPAIVMEVDGPPDDELAEVVAAVQRRVAGELELQLDRVVLVAPGAVPKTTSGKIQRSLCRAHLLDGRLHELDPAG